MTLQDEPLSLPSKYAPRLLSISARMCEVVVDAREANPELHQASKGGFGLSIYVHRSTFNCSATYHIIFSPASLTPDERTVGEKSFQCKKKTMRSVWASKLQKRDPPERLGPWDLSLVSPRSLGTRACLQRILACPMFGTGYGDLSACEFEECVRILVTLPRVVSVKLCRTPSVHGEKFTPS